MGGGQQGWEWKQASTIENGGTMKVADSASEAESFYSEDNKGHPLPCWQGMSFVSRFSGYACGTFAFAQLGEIKAVEIHDLVPGGNKVMHELFLVVVLGVDLSQGAQL
jgi:hypothetical protein